MAEIKDEKIFEHYLVLPTDVRMAVINEMRPNDRCRFTRCSKLSQKEAQKCKNYIYGMRFSAYSENDMVLYVLFSGKYKNTYSGEYTMLFSLDHDRRKYITYKIPSGVELWRNQLDCSTNLKEYACEYVKNMLNIHKRTIKLLRFSGVGNNDFEIGSLSNLESLELGTQTDIQQYISKIQKPLKELVCDSPISKEIAADFEQIYQVQDLFKGSIFQMNYAQFQKFSAKKMCIDIGNLTEEDICDFIKCWQNDKIRNNFISCRWNIGGSRFDIQELLRLLRMDQDVEEMQFWTTIDIMHNTDAGKKAELYFMPFSFKLRVISQ